MTQPAPRPAAAGLSRDDVFRVLGALGAILTLVTALLFYFGWRRSDAQSRAMGIDVSLFGFTSQDYVLRSISSLYLPLLLLAALGLAWVGLHGVASASLSRRAAAPGPDRDRVLHWARWTSLLALVVAVGCLAFTVAAGSQDPAPTVGWLAQRLASRRWLVPLVLLVSVVVIAYSRWVQRVLGPSREEPRAPWRSVLSGALAGVILVLCCFWMLEEYAAAVGRGYAQQLLDGVDRLPRATVTSPTPLGIRAPGVSEHRVGEQGALMYRTTGLRLLARSGSKILLVHDGWQPGSGVVVVLPDSDSFSWEFSR